MALHVKDIDPLVAKHEALSRDSWTIYKSNLKGTLEKTLGYSHDTTDLYAYINNPMDLANQLLHHNTPYKKAENVFKTLKFCAEVAVKYIDSEHSKIKGDALEMLRKYKTDILDVVYKDHPKPTKKKQTNVIIKKQEDTVNEGESEHEESTYDSVHDDNESEDLPDVPDIEVVEAMLREKLQQDSTDAIERRKMWNAIEKQKHDVLLLKHHVVLLQEVIEELIEINPNGIPPKLFTKVLRAATQQFRI